uniref:Uncharacterized protein n=1 Tax=Panagrellus redivivus TaxID=6233 RepID=A0A7E4WAX5_PANRE
MCQSLIDRRLTEASRHSVQLGCPGLPSDEHQPGWSRSALINAFKWASLRDLSDLTPSEDDEDCQNICHRAGSCRPKGSDVSGSTNNGQERSLRKDNDVVFVPVETDNCNYFV